MASDVFDATEPFLSKKPFREVLPTIATLDLVFIESDGVGEGNAALYDGD
jgi:hypothetical protein